MGKLLHNLSMPWRFPDPTFYTFTSTTIVDTKNGEFLLNKKGHIKDNFNPSDYTVIYCTGKYLRPGLPDFQVHLVVSRKKQGYETLRPPLNVILMKIGCTADRF